MSPLNRGPLMGPRMPPAGMRPPPPRFGRLPMPNMPPRMPPPPPPPPPPHAMAAMFGPMRPRMPPPRPGGIMRPGGPPPLFGGRNRGPPPLMLPMMGPRGMGPRGPLIRPGPRGILPPQVLPHMRPRFPPNNANIKAKVMNNSKKVNKLEELELKKPWMTDEIRSEIQKKNKLYAKAKKNKDAKEWEEFKDLRNKVTRMIRDAKNEYLAKNPESEALYQDEPEYFDERDENNLTSEDEEINYYCEMCDREFLSEQLLNDHNETHKVCGIDGCTFAAHPKLIEKHINMQHRTGLYHKIKNLSTPEEIANWINERKRKYPTKTCIELKKAEKSEQQERGEVIKNNKTNNTSRQNKNQTQIKNRRNKRSRLPKEKKIEEQDEVKTYRGVRPFLGTKSLDEKIDCDEATSVDRSSDNEIIIDTNKISDDEEEISTTITNPVVPIKSLGSLVADYSSDMDDEGPEEIPAKKIKIDMEDECNSVSNQDTCVVSNDNKENDGKIKEIETDLNTENQNESTKNSSNPKINRLSIKSNGVLEKKNRIPKRQMLLQRLLSRSITHERNFICQCIKYIEDNNYFLSTAKSHS